MARKLRVEEIGFYHIINRGVEKRTIFIDDDDCVKFLEIMQDSAEVYGFRIHSYCLMGNHYHLLLQTTTENLSLIMRQINSRYSIYFNNKYKRVGPLWQGRFKSWYVYDNVYLNALLKYIEFNPIKAGIVEKIGQYPWSMSSREQNIICLDYELMDQTDLTKKLNSKELDEIDALFAAKFDIKNDEVVQQTKKELSEHFNSFHDKETGIANAIADGYKQAQIAKYLKLSNVSISKSYKIYKQKVQLFNKLRDKGIFWSYSKNISYDEAGSNLLIEYLLKYGDFEDISLGFELFGKRVIKRVWEEKLKSDKRFIKLNLMIARVFFGMDVESSYVKEVKNARLEKFKLLAS